MISWRLISLTPDTTTLLPHTTPTDQEVPAEGDTTGEAVLLPAEKGAPQQWTLLTQPSLEVKLWGECAHDKCFALTSYTATDDVSVCNHGIATHSLLYCARGHNYVNALYYLCAVRE